MLGIPFALLAAALLTPHVRDFRPRDAAEKGPAQLGDVATPALGAALKASELEEQTDRLERLLKKLEGPITDPETVRRLRAIEVLERMAGGATGAVVTTEAEAAVKRVGKRGK